jgi:hypothetical protein
VLSELCCPFVEAETVKNLGGVCQIAGVALVVWDLLALTRYRGDLARAAARLRSWWAAMRRLLGRPRGQTIVPVGMVEEGEAANALTVRKYPPPFVAAPGQSLEDQVAALARLVNGLLDEVIREPQDRKRAILEERQESRAELRAEAERREAAVGALREAFIGLEGVTTGGTRLRWEGVPVLLVGVAFTTWPDGVAEHWPGWLPWRVLVLLAAFYAAARLSGALSTR